MVPHFSSAVQRRRSVNLIRLKGRKGEDESEEESEGGTNKRPKTADMIHVAPFHGGVRVGATPQLPQ